MRIRLASLPLVVLVALGAAAAGQRGASAPAAEVVAAERAFAARAQQVDPRDAFVEWFAPDAIAFGQGPAPAFPGLTEGPPWGIDLRWRPVDAGIARSGDFGWTTGPAEFRKAKTDPTPYRWGFYTSVWMKQADGRWKVAADIGADVPQPTMAVPDWDPATSSARAAGSAHDGDGDRDDDHHHAFDRHHDDRDHDHDGWRPRRHGPTLEQRAQELLAADRALASRAAERAPQAFAAALLRDARYHRDGIPPAVGKDAALGALRDGAATFGWAPAGARVAASGELGFSYGSGEKRTTTGALPFHYLAIWERHDGRWKLRVLVHHLAPPRKPAG